jgi:hypothetical protein
MKAIFSKVGEFDHLVIAAGKIFVCCLFLAIGFFCLFIIFVY